MRRPTGHDAEGAGRSSASGAYDENPMGVVSDPGRTIADHEGGRPIEETAARPESPEGLAPRGRRRGRSPSRRGAARSADRPSASAPR